MATQWFMEGPWFKNCNCDPGCPCDFNQFPTHDHCEGMVGMRITKGNFGGVDLSGLHWAGVVRWPGAMHEGNGELQPIDTTQWYPMMMRKDYMVAANLTGTYVDDPDALLYENYACGGVGNYNGYCNKEIDKLIDQQSMEADQEKRKRLVWEIERRLTEDVAKPLAYFNKGATCWQPNVKNLTVMENSIYNGWRMEDIWLE